MKIGCRTKAIVDGLKGEGRRRVPRAREKAGRVSGGPCARDSSVMARGIRVARGASGGRASDICFRTPMAIEVDRFGAFTRILRTEPYAVVVGTIRGISGLG